MDFNKYKDFNAGDFADDEHFKNWVLNNDPRCKYFWEKYIATYPLQQKKIKAAKELLKEINKHFKNEINKISEKQTIASFENLNKKINQSTGRKNTPIKKIKNKRRRIIWWTAAASIVFIIVFFGQGIFHKNHAAKIYRTGNGELLAIVLPNNSKVDLNANSTLVYFPKKWNQLDAREVWLEGEAFFDIKKKVERTKYFVHADELNLEVLGTQFNVRNRDGESEVVLEEGKINLEIGTANAREKIHQMQPGDYVGIRLVRA